MVEWFKRVVARVQDVLIAGLDRLVSLGDRVVASVQSTPEGRAVQVKARSTVVSCTRGDCGWMIELPHDQALAAYVKHVDMSHR